MSIDGDLASLNWVEEKCEMVFSNDKDREKMIKDVLSDESQEISASGKEYLGGGHTGQVQDVVEAICEKRAPLNTLAEACNSAALIMAVYESARNNGARTLVKKYV